MQSVYSLSLIAFADIFLGVVTLALEWYVPALEWNVRSLPKFDGKKYEKADEWPYFSHGSDTVPSWAVVAFAFFAYLPLFLVMGDRLSSRNVVLSGSALERQKSSGSVLSLGKFTPLAFYFSGILLVYFILNVLKVLVGKPRPSFYHSINCEDNFNNCNMYMKDRMNFDRWIRSFPSGHSALSMYPAVFIAFDVMKTSKWWIGPVLCLLGMLIGATRTWDHRHDWQDVTAGFILAYAVAFGVHTLMMRAAEDEGEKLEEKSESESHSPQNVSEDEKHLVP